MLEAFRRTGADLPFGDQRRAHGTPLEGYYWRITDAARRTVVVALCGINRDGLGGTWATVALAARTADGRTWVRDELVEVARAAPDGLGVLAGRACVATERSLGMALPGAHLELTWSTELPWPARRALGGVGLGQLVPGLSQYWHPHLLRGTVQGSLELDGTRVALDGATVYAEKNWGHGFPGRWWWGQAHAFDDPEAVACLAFAGGEVLLGPVRTEATALVLHAGGRLLRRAEPRPLGVRAEVGETGWRLRAGRVEVEGHANGGDAVALPVPVPEQRRNITGADQHLAGEVTVTVRRRGGVVLRATSSLAGLEQGTAVSSATPWSPSTAPSSMTSSPAPSPRTSATAT